MRVSVHRAISSFCLSKILGMTVNEVVSVSKGNLTLDGGGVRTVGPQDSQTNVLKSSSSRIAAEIASWKLGVYVGAASIRGITTNVGWDVV